MNSPASNSRRAVGVEGAVEDERLGQAGAGGPGRAAAPRARPASIVSVLRGWRASAGSLPAASSARAVSGPSASHHSCAIHSGCEWRSAASAGVSSVSGGDHARPSRAARRSTALTSRAPRGRRALGELDALADGGVRGDAVEEQQLEGAEPQRRQHGGLELRGGRPASAAIRASSVARRWTAPYASCVANARSRASRPMAGRLAVQGAIGPCVLARRPAAAPRTRRRARGAHGAAARAEAMSSSNVRPDPLRARLSRALQSVEAPHFERRKGRPRMPVPHNPDDGRASSGLRYTLRDARRRRDLRYAAVRLARPDRPSCCSAGAAIAPLVGLNDWPSFQRPEERGPRAPGQRPAGRREAPQRTPSRTGSVDAPTSTGPTQAQAQASGSSAAGGSAPARPAAPRASSSSRAGAAHRGHSAAARTTRRRAAASRSARSRARADTDGDGLPDSWERFYGTDPNRDDAREDSDGDGLSNGAEFRLGTNPRARDCNGDGRDDGHERQRRRRAQQRVRGARGHEPAAAEQRRPPRHGRQRGSPTTTA